jgi:two-component system cell cycle response regulator
MGYCGPQGIASNLQAMHTSEKFIELKATGSLPSPTGTAMKLIELCQQNDVALPEIIHTLQSDPGLVGRVLKMANSPVYGRMRPVVSLSQDVLMTIGFQSLRQVVLAFSLVSAHRSGQCPNFDYQAFWSRSIALGVAAELIGAEARVAPPVEMFTCGLLSLVGKLALASIHREPYGAILADAYCDTEALLDRETEQFGLNHAEISAAMMTDWGIPRFFCDAVMYQEFPERAPFSENSRRTRLIWCFHLAWRMSALCCLQDGERAAALAQLEPLGRKFDMDTAMLVSLANQMLVEWREWARVLEIQVRDVPDFALPAPALPLEEPMVTTTEFRIGAEAGEDAMADILLVHRDPAMIAAVEALLKEGGHNIHVAGDDRAALRIVLERQPQIMLAEWPRPGPDTTQLIRTLRETEVGRFLHIMVLVDGSDRQGRMDALNLGADDVVTLPIDTAEFHAHFKAALRMVSVQRELIRECDLLRRNALQLTIANQRAEEAALTDSLTALYNRRYAMDRLAREWVACERTLRPLSILLIDIDHFKTVNDNHGHNIGDLALKRLSEMLSEHSRRPDIACRIGGEEFFILAPETGLPGALRQAERLREAFENCTLEIEGIRLRLTVSIGVAQKMPGMVSPEELLKIADEALYRAKREGRNRVVAATLE